MESDKKMTIGLIVAVAVVAAFAFWWASLPEAVEDVVDSNRNGQPADNLIRISSPEAGDIIKSPLEVRGEARGNWYFEANFPVRIEDEAGRLLGERFAEAEGEWMTTEFVPFAGRIEFEQSAVTTTGFVIFEKANPSGLSEQADERRVRVEIAPATQI